MTKTEFRRESGKADINPNVYGLVLNTTFHTKDFNLVTDGKVVGIVWHEEWVKKVRYSPMWGENVDATSLGKVPYVVLKKGNATYEVEAWKIRGYLYDLFDKFLIDMGKAQAQEKKDAGKSCRK